MRIKFHARDHFRNGVIFALTASLLAGGATAALTMATNNGEDPMHFQVPNGQTAVVEYIPPTPDKAERATRQASTANKARAILPCREEDGSRQWPTCVWDSGDGRGDIIVNVSRKGRDDRTIVLVDRTPNR